MQDVCGKDFRALVILKRKGSSCFGGDPGYHTIRLSYQRAGNLDLTIQSIHCCPNALYS